MGACSGKMAETAVTTAATKEVELKFSTFTCADSKGGCEVVPSKAALVCIEYQNEVCTTPGDRCTHTVSHAACYCAIGHCCPH